MNWSGLLRSQLRQGALDWARSQSALEYQSRGDPPTILFAPAADRSSHGNFEPRSWRAITTTSEWADRLEKPHQRRDALPGEYADQACELDSSTSSDALLMNCFCHPGAAFRILSRLNLAAEEQEPKFGFRAHVPKQSGEGDKTEIDLKYGSLEIEAKLTEQDFSSKREDVVLGYRDLDECFHVDVLPRSKGKFLGYQLIRNVLAAMHHNASFVVLLDARRPDLLHEWWTIHSAIRPVDLRLRCGVRTWQEVARAAPKPLQDFLAVKYMIQ